MGNVKHCKKITVYGKSANNFMRPVDSFEMVNKYGTYNIQPTAEGEWEYPAISQGLPKQKD